MATMAVTGGSSSRGGHVAERPYGQQPKRPPPYRVRVFDRNLGETLLMDEADPRGSHQASKASARSKTSDGRGAPRSKAPSAEEVAKHAEEAKRQRRYQQHKLALQRQEQEQQRRLSDQLLEAAEQKEDEFARLYGEVMEGHQFVDELDRIMDISDATERAKKLKQYEDWHNNVFATVQTRIDEALGVMSSREINEKRRADMDKFLAATNAKAAIFRDIIIESEYDPLEPNRRAVKARVESLRNPCSRVLDKLEEENNMLRADGVPEPPAPGRPTLDVQLWEALRIKDTPHGFFAKIMDQNARAGEGAAQVGGGGGGGAAMTGGANGGGGGVSLSKTFATSFTLDDYNVQRGRDVVSKEFPKGKKTYTYGEETVGAAP